MLYISFHFVPASMMKTSQCTVSSPEALQVRRTTSPMKSTRLREQGWRFAHCWHQRASCSSALEVAGVLLVSTHLLARGPKEARSETEQCSSRSATFKSDVVKPHSGFVCVLMWGKEISAHVGILSRNPRKVKIQLWNKPLLGLQSRWRKGIVVQRQLKHLRAVLFYWETSIISNTDITLYLLSVTAVQIPVFFL